MSENQLTVREVALIALLVKHGDVDKLTDEQLADLAEEADAIAKAKVLARRALNKRQPKKPSIVVVRAGSPE